MAKPRFEMFKTLKLLKGRWHSDEPSPNSLGYQGRSPLEGRWMVDLGPVGVCLGMGYLRVTVKCGKTTKC